MNTDMIITAILAAIIVLVVRSVLRYAQRILSQDSRESSAELNHSRCERASKAVKSRKGTKVDNNIRAKRIQRAKLLRDYDELIALAVKQENVEIVANLMRAKSYYRQNPKKLDEIIEELYAH